MVWPFSSSSGGGSKDAPSSQRDPLRDLDPSLREFLERESPVKYRPPAAETASPSSSSSSSTQSPSPLSAAAAAAAAAASSSPSSSSSASAQNASSQTDSPTNTTNTTNVPTLFKDGRYAHLWSTYRPLSEIEDTNTSPQDKLADILAGYRDRKANIGRAALENCALEQFNLNDCYRNGAVSERFLNCRSYMHKLDRCYNMNQRLLRALGYLAAYDRGADVEEQIQMHADKLYQNMMAQEENEAVEVEKASKSISRTGMSTSSSSSNNDTTSTSTTTSTTTTEAAKAALAAAAAAAREQTDAEARTRRGFDASLDPSLLQKVEALRPKVREKFGDRLAKLAPDQRPLEERALAMELLAGKQVVQTVDALRDRSSEQRDDRIKRGEGTVQDRLAKLLGW